jgi:DNA (cytosine-5)-methyltransferase 1
MGLDNISIFDCMYKDFKTNKPIRLIELFAGVGSQAMALRNIGANFEHYKVVEYDKYALASYNAIHGTNFKPTDITQVKGKDLGIKDTDKFTYIMTYSFPCQDLSVAGKRKGMSKNSGTRSGLLWEVERLLNETEYLPQILLMENVPQVIGEQNIKDFQMWQKFLEDKGYSNFVEILNAKNYGVAQNRERCFMVSILGEYNYKFPKPIELTKTMKNYLEEEVDEKYYIKNDKAQKLISELIKTDKLSKPNKVCVDGTINNPDIRNIANCITAKYDCGVSNFKATGNMVVEPSVKQIGNLTENTKRDNPQPGRVYSTEGISPTLNTMQGGNKQPMIVSETQKNSIICEQRQDEGIRLFKENICGTLRTIDAGGDKRIIEMTPTIVASGGRNKDNPSDRTAGIELEQRLEANSEGICNTLTSVQKDNWVLEPSYRIRKLIPLECWRLMGFTDEDFYKAEKVNSNTQLYKQAGNSIVVDVLEAIFRNLL